ncbi:hypothetical protein Micbo1qcDRAFT_178209 [Microdochium bolleyi]|uniref:Uncharacterized protein n=1 Tax=Microdochium bolleyi TaxID=196109 RepID=A0A136IUZ0_9PEZI|nr:hypothetical protein Micbo1qcDRAFT_178209 [Microdochium bolleyi]
MVHFPNNRNSAQGDRPSNPRSNNFTNINHGSKLLVDTLHDTATISAMDDLLWSSDDVLAHTLQLASQATLFPGREDTVACFQAIELILYYAREHSRWPTHADLHSLQHTNPLLLRLACATTVTWLCSARRHGLVDTQLALLSPHAQRMMDLVVPWADPFATTAESAMGTGTSGDIRQLSEPDAEVQSVEDGRNGDGGVIPSTSMFGNQNERGGSEASVTVREHASFVDLTGDDPSDDDPLMRILSTDQDVLGSRPSQLLSFGLDPLIGGGPAGSSLSPQPFNAINNEQPRDIFNLSDWLGSGSVALTEVGSGQQPGNQFSTINQATLPSTLNTTTSTTTTTTTTSRHSSGAFAGLTQYHNNLERQQSAAMSSVVSQVYPTDANCAATTATADALGVVEAAKSNLPLATANMMDNSTWLFANPLPGEGGAVDVNAAQQQALAQFHPQAAFRMLPTLGGLNKLPRRS